MEPANGRPIPSFLNWTVIRFTKKYWTVLWVGLVVLWVRLLLQVKTLPLVLDQLSRCSLAEIPDAQEMGKLAYYVDRWLQLFPYNRKGNCFPRSLALYWFARRLGYPVLFRCGVKKGMRSLDGHAWLTVGGQPFYELGRHWQDYTVTFSYPQDSVVSGDPGLSPRSQNDRTTVS